MHKVLQEGHPTVLREAQANTDWLKSLTRGISGEGIRGASPANRLWEDECMGKMTQSDLRRLWTSFAGVCLLPHSQIGIPSAAPRVQWYQPERSTI